MGRIDLQIGQCSLAVCRVHAGRGPAAISVSGHPFLEGLLPAGTSEPREQGNTEIARSIVARRDG
jgi:hypothetical protein